MSGNPQTHTDRDEADGSALPIPIRTRYVPQLDVHRHQLAQWSCPNYDMQVH
jgi:hypothetical protein